ncbi:salivary peroxidase/catechol oxidase-like isoform X2 [Dermatophagoides pteronyssinus]|uniref:salivary peroxidase/catechol oxidase-like isoform X2 n=1 Tax=Dermatophagoides pteronyssinus TaxID=6956 RepID=UPI003F67AB42
MSVASVLSSSSSSSSSSSLLIQPISQSTQIRPSWSSMFQTPSNQSLIQTPLSSLNNRTRLKNVNRNKIPTNRFTNQTLSIVSNRYDGQKILPKHKSSKMMTESMAIEPEPPIWIAPTSLDRPSPIVAEFQPIQANPLMVDFMPVEPHLSMYHSHGHHHHHHNVHPHPHRHHHHPLHMINTPPPSSYPHPPLLPSPLSPYHMETFGNVLYDHHHSLYHPNYIEQQYHPGSDMFYNPDGDDIIVDNSNIHNNHNHNHNGHDDSDEADTINDNNYMLESVPPVAQNMLFSEQQKNSNYYTPFKVNSINVYSDYLTDDDDSDNGDDDDDEDDNGDNNGEQNDSKQKYCPNKKDITRKDVDDAIKNASSKLKWYSRTIEKNAIQTKRRSPYIPPGMLDSKLFEYASKYLKDRKCLNKMDVITKLPKINVRRISSHYEMSTCSQEERIVCEPKAKFRSIDGSCNNLKYKTWGKSFTCHRRLLPPNYADGVAEPRIAYDGGKLPNARDISSQLLPDVDVQDHKLTSMTMAFGQFIIHDIARTLPLANDIRCCPSKSAKHPECFAIDIIRSDDILVKYFNQTCINFVRSIVCNPCALGPREQQNQATHTFDMSHMYGLRLNDSLALRSFRGGKLRGSLTSTYPKEELPPKMTREDPSCNVRPKPPRFKCFETADGVRASQHPALQSLHTAFHRRHNQHADALSKINPHWNDEKLYQEARHIMIAEVSVMIYGQYLSAIFGRKMMKHFRLGLNKHGYTRYDPKLNPSTFQEFITASGRFGHSQVNDRFRVLFGDDKTSYAYNLRDNFFETTIVSLGHSAGVLKGLSSDPTQASDNYFVNDIKNALYRLRRDRTGRDLPAFNIQRGREHGIPGYIYYLDFCFGYKVQQWNDLVTFIPKKHVKKIRQFYKHWKDIDLFVGGVFERLISGAAFGPTFGCINGIQFYNFKYGDRFYFEHGYQSGSFNEEQLDNIRSVASLSSLICKTHQEIKQMPSNPFIQPSPHKNPMIPCFKFSEFDYDLWKDKKGKNIKYSTTMSKPATVVYGSAKFPMGPPLPPPPPPPISSLYSLPKKLPPVMTKIPPGIGYSKQYHYQYPTKKSPKLSSPSSSTTLMTDFSERKDNQ